MTETIGRLRRNLSPFEVLLLTLSCLSPVLSIFGVGGDVLHQAGTGAVPLFIIGIGAAVVWAAMYAELGSAYPYAGADYVGVGSILGSWAGVVTLAIWAATAGPSIAFTAETLQAYVGQLVPGAPLGLVPFLAIAAGTSVALLGVRTGALVTGVFLALELIAVAALIVVGLRHPLHGLGAALTRPSIFVASGASSAVGLPVLALAGISAVFGTVGGNQALAFGEELSEPRRNMGRVVLIAALVGAFATALPVILLVLGASDLPVILRSPAPFATFLSKAVGPWAGSALSAAVVIALFNVVIVGLMACGRLFFSLGRDCLFNRASNELLAKVHARSGVPRGATLVVSGFSLACCFLAAHVLLVFLTGLLVYGWSLVCLAVLIGRRKGLTGQPGYWRSFLFPLLPVLGLAMAAAITLGDLLDADVGRPSLLLLGAVVAVALIWNQFFLQRRPGGWKPTLAGAAP